MARKKSSEKICITFFKKIQSNAIKRGLSFDLDISTKAFKEFKGNRTNDLIEEKFYWKLRCQLAEDYIQKSPIDPDINAEQIIAYQYWQIEVEKQKTD